MLQRRLAFLFVLLVGIRVHARDIAITLDDCPRRAGPIFAPLERDQRIADALATEGIVAAFFCNSPTRADDGNERLRYLASRGHLIANHSAFHPDLFTTPVDEYIRNIYLADVELRGFPNFRPWFRFPYLREGKNAADVEAVRAQLRRMGYTNGYVTVDTQDWYVDAAVRQKLDEGKHYNATNLCQTYAAMVTDEAQFYDDMSVKALGRSVKHTLLLHETDLNALCLVDVLRSLRADGWSLISPDEAYSDPIAKTEPSSSTLLDQGRVCALAKEAGYTGPYYNRWNESSEIDKELEARQVWRD